MSQRGARRNLFVVCIFLAVLQLQCWRFSNPIIAYQRRTRLSSSNQPTAEELLDGFDNPPMELFEALYPSVDFGKKSTEIRYDEEAGIFKYVDIPEPISLDQIKPLKKVEYTRKALESIWTDLCRQKIIKGKITQMKIDDLLPHLMNETSIIDIIYKNFRERDEDVLPVYTTYRELRTLWLTNRNGLKVNEEKEFNVKEALLLLDDFDPTDLQTSIFGKDEDEDEEEGETEKKAEKKDAKEKKVKKKKGKKEIIEEEIIEEENVAELIVTDQELRRVWRDKSKQQIGLPSKEYSDSSAFLLLDSALENDEFDFGDEEYYEAYMLPEINDPPERVPFGKFDPDDEEEDYPTLSAEEWKELGVSIEDLEDEVDEELDADTYTDEFYDAIEEAANELDHTPFFVNPIDRSMDITPGDMLEQFAGEMNYVEFTIDPAVDRIENLNWDSIPGLSNSKLDVLNYLTLPNEEFIDYNIPKKRSWELFDFPWGPDYDQLGGRRNPAQPETESDAKNPLSAYQVENYDGVLKFPEDEDHEEGTTNLSREEEDELFGDIDSVDDDGEIEGAEIDEESNNNNVDWDNFDFGAVNGDENPATSLVSSLPPSSDPNSESYDEDAYEEDWMQFHSVILAKQAKEKGFRKKLRYDEGLYTPFMDEYVNSSLWDNPNQVYDGLLSKRLENVYSSPVKDFKVPKHWLTRKRYENYVGIEEYNKNIQYEEIGDNMDDVYEILSLQTVLDIMNLYLNDHMKIARKQDERKAFDRYYQAKLYNKSVTYPVLEPIPIMMIPDKDRGIQYSSQIFESNAQYQLFPYVPEPIVAFANESFDANPHTQYEFDSGSLLENYDWFPQKDLVHEIEEEKVESLQPIITFINHAGKLLSTKDDIIIFDYYGKMRDLAGIRVMMLGMAKECYPQIKDLRLETSRTHDSFDVGDHDWADPAEYVSRPLVKDDVFI